MKAVGCLVTLCLLAGFISAADQYAWQVGKTYTYKASGRLMAGITEINTQYAGMVLSYYMDLVPIGPNRLILKPTNFKIQDLNEEQDGGWRDVPELKGETPAEIPPEVRKYLESPIEVKFEKGVVASIKVQGDLPNYAINIKKAQVSSFVLDSAAQNAVMTGNINREIPNQVRPQDPTTQSGSFFETMEQTVTGECETYYTVSESGPYENPRADPLKAQLADDDESDENNKQSGESRAKDDSSEESQENNWQHAKYMAYQEMIKRSGSNEETGVLAAEVFHNFCVGKHRLMEFTKTVNYSMCHKKPVLGYASPSLIVDSRAGDNSLGNGQSRVTYSRYITCGRDRKQLTILKVEQEEYIYQGTLRKEKTLGGTSKNVTLKQVLPTSRTPVGPTNPIEISDLTYKFSLREQKMRRDGKLKTAFEYQYQGSEDNNQDSQSDENETRSSEENATPKYRPRRYAKYYAQQPTEQQYEMDKQEYTQWANAGEDQERLPLPSMLQPPMNPLLASPLDAEGMKVRIGVLLNEIAQDILGNRPIAEQETVDKIATMSKMLRYLPNNDIEVLYHRHADKTQTEEDQIKHKIFLEAVAMAGTNPNIKLLIDLINRKLVVGEEANQLIMTFSMYIRTPTPELIHYFYEKLVDFSPSPDNMDQQKTTAWLAFTNLLHDACVNTKIANTRYPVQIYGEFCSPMVVGEYLPQIVKHLKWALEQINHDEHSVGASHWATVFLASLGNTGHPSIVEHIQKVLDTAGDQYIKVKAIFALKRLVVSRSPQNVPVVEPMATDRKSRDIVTDEVVEKKVLPVLMSAALDKTEDQQVRMAAVALLARTTPADITIWQTLAYSTWFETNQEVLSYIYHMISSLSKLQNPSDPVTWHAHKKARQVLPMVKPINIGLPRSRVHHESAFWDEIQSGFLHHWSQFGSENSAFPNAFYYQNYKFYGGAAVAESPIELAVHGHTLKHIVEHIVGKFQRATQSQVDGNELIKIISDLLHIVDREQDETPQASLQFKLRAEMERIFSVNREVIDLVIEQLKKEVLPQLMNGIPINYQKAWKLSEINYEFPTIFGIPIQVKTKTHNLWSFRGVFKPLILEGMRDFSFHLDLHPIISYKTHGFVAFKSPINGKAYQAGVQHHAVVEFPFRAMFRKSRVGTVEFAITPTPFNEPQIGGQIDVVTFHRRPYTAIITDECWPTSHKEGGQIKIVHAVDTPFKEEREFGQKALGWAFELQQETDYQPEQEKYPGWTRYFRRFAGTYGGWLHKGLMGAKTLRYAERKLILDNVKSTTKTLYFVAAGQYHQHVKHAVNEVSSEENRQQPSGESNESKSDEEEKAYRVYGTRTGDYQSYQDKKLKQRPYQDYKQYKYERYQASQEKDSSQESSEEYHGEFKYYSGKPEYYRASYEQAYEAPYQYGQAYEQTPYQYGQEPGSRHRRWFVVAIFGKTSPLHPALKLRTVQQQHETSPSTVQYLFSVDYNNNYGLIKVSAGEPTKEHANELPMNSAAVEKIRKLIDSLLTKGQQPFCGSYEGKYELPRWANRDSLLTLRENILRQELKVKAQGEIAFGNSCRNKIHNITFTGKLARDEEMTQFAKTESYEAKQCTEDEKKGFASSPVCIINSEQQAAALNVAEFEFRATPLPAHVMNATLQVREFFKAWLYEYMSYDPMPIRPTSQRVIDNYLKVQVKLTPEIDYLTLKFFRPDEQIFFQNIKLSPFARAVFPVTATQTLKENIRDRVFKTEASCSVEGKHVNTFDNVTYHFDPSAATNCKHVLVQDCSGQQAVSVFADNLGTSNLITTVLTEGNFRITLIPTLRQQATEESPRAYVTTTNNDVVVPGQGRVLVNGVPVVELPANIFDKLGHLIARVEEAAGASLQLFSDDVKVTTDGRHIVVYPSNKLRNTTCGLCGNFDVSKTIDFRSPRDCPLSSGTYMYAAYAFQLPAKTPLPIPPPVNVCKIDAEVKKAIEKEDRACQIDELVPLYGADAQYGNCKDTLVTQIGDAVYSIVRNALKPIPGVNGKKWADKARNKVKELLQGAVNAKDIADIIASGIASMIPVVGGVVKPLIRLAVQKIVEVICSKSGCCDAVWYF